ITSEDLGGMMQYQVVCEGEGVLYCSLSDCGLGGSNGVNFTCLIPADNFDHYLVELLTEPVGSFCDYCGNTTEVKPSGWQLEDCYPNPFNPTTTIEYSLAEPCGVTMNVYNMSGQYVANLVNRRMPGGTHSVVLDASHLMSGVYTVHLQAGKFTASQRVTLLK
ncbi:MAG: T9SS type A sorting domain-containing protein, partial [Candidatus Delongbacteria bacterium]|nr:T9SS type A sorting domain-containing protein [Candidatus Delongbacteria bacterium]